MFLHFLKMYVFIFAVCVKFLKQGRCRCQKQNPAIFARVAKFRNPCKNQNFRNTIEISQPHCSCAYESLARRRQSRNNVVKKKKNCLLKNFQNNKNKFYIVFSKKKKKIAMYGLRIFAIANIFSQPSSILQPHFVLTITFLSELCFG